MRSLSTPIPALPWCAALLAAAALTVAWPVSALYKCQDAKGKTLYQDTACALDAQSSRNIKVVAGNGQSDTATRRAIAARRNKPNSPEQIAQALRLGEPVVGMSLMQMQQALGVAPVQMPVNAQTRGQPVVQYHFATPPGAGWIAAVAEGRVLALSPSAPQAAPPLPATPLPAAQQANALPREQVPAAPAAAASKPPAAACPSALDLRNAQVAANSSTISAAERYHKQAIVRALLRAQAQCRQ